MQLNITGKNVKISPNIRDVVNKKIQKVIRNFNRPIDGNIILTKEKNKVWTEIILIGDHGKFYFKKSGGDVYSSIENAINTADLGIKKFKGKQREKKHRETMGSNNEKMGASRRIYDYDIDELKPISIEEAFLQMKYMRKTFILFLNVKTEKYNVMFRDNDKTFVIAPPSGFMSVFKKKGDGLEKYNVEYKNNKVKIKKKEQIIIDTIKVNEAINRLNSKNRFCIYKDADNGKIHIIFSKNQYSYWRAEL